MPLHARRSRAARRAVFPAALLAVLTACAPGAGPPLMDAAARPSAGVFASAPGRPRTVVLISVEGLQPSHYAAPAAGVSAPWMPWLAQRGREGLRADRVAPVHPSGRYPAHATLVTGRHPDGHGVSGDHLLGDRGVRSTPPWHASHVQSSSIWQLALADRQRVVALDWPSTAGAAADGLIPALAPRRSGEGWLARLQGAATPLLLEALEREMGDETGWPTPERRDRAMASLACDVLVQAAPPSLLLLRLAQGTSAFERAGIDGDAARAAFAAVDRELARLAACAKRGGHAERVAFLVAGDRAFVPVHTVLEPNIALERAGLVAFDPRVGSGVGSWQAIARPGGGAAQVYARNEAAALAARTALLEEAERTAAFRIVPAAELGRLHSDPNAWFGLQARAGYAFGARARGAAVHAASARAADGVDPLGPDAAVGLVGFGRGLRGGVRLPDVRQVDVAPTVAALLGILLDGADGRILVGALALEAPR